MKTLAYTDSSHLLLVLLILILLGRPDGLIPGREPMVDLPFAETALDATVLIRAVEEDSIASIARRGSGVLISAEGLVVTSQHLVGAADRIEVGLYRGDRYLAEVLAVDTRTDLALLRIPGNELPHLPLGRSARLRIGEPVFAVGNPQNLDFTLTSGIVGALNRRLNVLPDPQRREQFIQTDVPINHGSSGGPLLNRRGELVGIVAAITTQSGYFEGYSFAVPVELLQPMLEQQTVKNGRKMERKTIVGLDPARALWGMTVTKK